MREPLTRAPLEIRTVHSSDHHMALARTGLQSLRASSTSSTWGAAWNLALRYFWGGNTNAFCGDEERERVYLTELPGPHGTDPVYMASVDRVWKEPK